MLARGAALFSQLANLANGGDPTGIGYAQFVCHVYDVPNFSLVSGRNYLPSDAQFVVELAEAVTQAAGGRKPVVKGSTVIQAGMDTFIWNSSPPYDRPERAWQSRWSIPPYSREQWKVIFPDNMRRLLR